MASSIVMTSVKAFSANVLSWGGTGPWRKTIPGCVFSHLRSEFSSISSMTISSTFCSMFSSIFILRHTAPFPLVL